MNQQEKQVVLVVEDEPCICRFVTAVLTANGYQVETSASGREALEKCRKLQPAVMLLDLGLPDMDGIQVLECVKERYPVSVVVVSARTREEDKMEALQHGADEYVTKPFGTGELLECIQRAEHYRVQRRKALLEEKDLLVLGELTLDREKECALVRGQDIGLTHIEYILLAALVKNAGRVLTYDYLAEQAWPEPAADKTKKLRIVMTGLRKKLEENPVEPRYIFTEIGIGYRFKNQ